MQKNKEVDVEIYMLYKSENKDDQKKAKEIAVEYYEKYIHYIISKKYASFSEKYHDELFQCGVIGLIESLRSFDPKRSVLNTWSTPYIYHEMSDFTNQLQNISSPYYANIYWKIERCENNLKNKSEEISAEKIAEITGLNLKIVKKELKTREYRNSCELDENTIDISCSENKIINNIFANEIMSKIESKFTDKHTRIIRFHIYEGYTFSQIAEKMDISLKEAKRLYKQVIIGMRKEYVA